MENVADVYTLSPIQQGMLFHTISDPASGVCIEQICCRLTGQLDLPRFQSAWNQLVSRHDALRTIFLWEGLDDPLQVVREAATLPWSTLDWQDCPPAQLEQRISAYLTQDRTTGFDLSQVPLIRMTLIQTGAADYRFVWTFHHLLADGWSVALLLKEVLARYHAVNGSAASDTTELLPYRQFIEYLDNQPLDRAESFWRTYLAGFDTPTRLTRTSGKRLRPSEEGNPYRRRKETVSKAVSDQLKALARNTKVTLNTVILAAWSLVLRRYSGEHDLVFGRTVAGRPANLPGIETAIGLFVNTLPLRVRIGTESLTEWLREIQRQQISISEFEYSPLSQVQKWSEIPRGSALFESIVVFENYPTWGEGDAGSADLVASEFDFKEQSNYPLALLVVPGEEIELILIHDSSSYDQAFAHNLVEHVQQALAEIVADSSQPVCDIQCITERDRNASGLLTNPIETTADQRPVFRLIEDQAKSNPEAIAIRFNDNQLTYGALDQQAGQLADRLQAAGASCGDRVGLAVLRGPDLVIGILGILKIGAAYVPLDPQYPASHLSFVCQDAALRMVVTNQLSAPLLSDAIPASLFCYVDPPRPDQGAQGDQKPAEVDDHRLAAQAAYVIYTSGSQGQPKGVVVSHHNLTHSTLARRIFYQDPVNSFLLLSSFAFDSSVVGIFWTLADGGTLVLPQPDQEKEMHALADLIERAQVSHLLALPSLYSLLSQASRPEKLLSLTTVIVAGEACDPAVVNQHLAQLPSTRLYNEYGPTEATVWCLAAELTADNTLSSIPIGRPIANMSAYLLDHELKQVPPGVCGELYISGAGIAQGYLDRSELTRDRFIDNPFSGTGPTLYKTGDLAYLRADGQLVFAGRSDSQVKVRGHRIEPGEIETQLKGHAAIIDAAISIEDIEQDNTPDTEPDLEKLRERLLALGPLRSKQLIDEVLAIPEHELAKHLDSKQ